MDNLPNHAGPYKKTVTMVTSHLPRSHLLSTRPEYLMFSFLPPLLVPPRPPPGKKGSRGKEEERGTSRTSYHQKDSMSQTADATYSHIHSVHAHYPHFSPTHILTLCHAHLVSLVSSPWWFVPSPRPQPTSARPLSYRQHTCTRLQLRIADSTQRVCVCLCVCVHVVCACVFVCEYACTCTCVVGVCSGCMHWGSRTKNTHTLAHSQSKLVGTCTATLPFNLHTCMRKRGQTGDGGRS